MHNIKSALEGAGWVHNSVESLVMRPERRCPVIITFKLNSVV